MKQQMNAPIVHFRLSDMLKQVGTALSGRRYPVVAIALILLVAAVTTSLYRRLPWPEPDSSTYVTLASNLLRGRGYQYNDQPHILYPPGLPLIYAAVGSIFGLSHPVRMMTTGFFSFLTLVLSFLLLRRRGSDTRALLLTLLFGTSAYFVFFVTSLPYSDIPFCAFSLLCLYLTDRLDERGLPGWKRGGFLAALTLVLPLAVLIRSAGVALLPALGVFLLVRIFREGLAKTRRLLALLLPLAAGAAAYGSWTLWADAHRQTLYPGEASERYGDLVRLKDLYNPYLGDARAVDFGLRLVDNCGCAGSAIYTDSLSVGWIEPRIWSPFVVLPFLLALGMLLHSVLRPRGDAPGWFLVFYLAVSFAWFFCVDAARFLLPVVPILLCFVTAGGFRLLAFLRHDPGRFARWLMVLGAAGSAVCAAFWFGQAGRPSFQLHVASALWVLMLLAGGAAAVFAARRRKRVKLGRVIRPWIVGCGCGLAVFIVLMFTLHLVEARGKIGKDHEEAVYYPSVAWSAWIRENTTEQAVIMADSVAPTHTLSGRHVVKVPFSRDLDFIEVILARRRVDYLAVPVRGHFHRPNSRDLVESLRMSRRYALELADQGASYSLYRLVPK